MRELVASSGSGLNMDSLPYRLFQKAKRFGVWNPVEIDFTQDAEDWKSLNEAQRSDLLSSVAGFLAGEETVTYDILPLMLVVAKEGRLEEQMYLTTFLFEEAKHTEFFRLLLNAIGETGDLSHYHSPAYRKVFYELLPAAMNRLLTDQSPEAVAEASVIYNMFAEGVLAETGYWKFYESLQKIGKMPGMLKGITLLKTDESRHIAYGTFLLQRLICANPDMFDFVKAKLEGLLPLSMAINEEIIVSNPVENAFGIKVTDAKAFAQKQLQTRLEVLARARYQTMEEIYKTAESTLGVLESE